MNTAPRTAHRRRERHGRGLRRPLIGPHLPGHATRRDAFDTLVTETFAPLLERYGDRLAYVQVYCEDVPLPDPLHDGPVLGRYIPGDRTRPPRILIYRFPIEMRCTSREELADLVYIVAVENVAAALGIDPESIDPWFFER